jgi:hypothetical protein
MQVRPRDDVPALRWGNRTEDGPTTLLPVHLSPAMTNTAIPGRTGAAQSAFSDEGAIDAVRPKQVLLSAPMPTSRAGPTQKAISTPHSTPAASVGLLLIALLMHDVGATALVATAVGRSSRVLQFAQNYPAATAQQIASGCDPPSIWRHTMRGQNAGAIRSMHAHSGHHGEAPRHCHFRAASRKLHALVLELSGTV